VLGVSTDPVNALASFREKYDFPFRFLSDPEHRVHDEYGTWVEKNRMGKTYMGTARTTFVIGPDGILRHIFENVTPQGHAEEVLAVL
jgi:thioredoxin-dependent peroxiredoxin